MWLKESKEPILEYDSLKERVVSIIQQSGLQKLFDEYNNEKEELVFEAENYYESKESLERDLAELLALFEETRRRSVRGDFRPDGSGLLRANLVPKWSGSLTSAHDLRCHSAGVANRRRK